LSDTAHLLLLVALVLMSTLTMPQSRSPYWRFAKWSFMTSALFWLVVYRLSDVAEKLPDFVYVNF
jgi:hypothetical protein